jgi:hypothetical protein
MYGVNIGCLESVTEEELSRIPVTRVDGANDRFCPARHISLICEGRACGARPLHRADRRKHASRRSARCRRQVTRGVEGSLAAGLATAVLVVHVAIVCFVVVGLVLAVAAT